MNDAYFDKNQAAMLAAKLAQKLGYAVGWGIDPVEGEDWKEIVKFDKEWDEHSVETKRNRIRNFIGGN